MINTTLAHLIFLGGGGGGVDWGGDGRLSQFEGKRGGEEVGLFYAGRLLTFPAFGWALIRGGR